MQLAGGGSLDARVAPHVAMIVCNEVTADSRVQKSAGYAAAAGYRVTVVGMAPDGVWGEIDGGGYRILRVPVPLSYKRQLQRRLGEREMALRAGAPWYRERSLNRLEVDVPSATAADARRRHREMALHARIARLRAGSGARDGTAGPVARAGIFGLQRARRLHQAGGGRRPDAPVSGGAGIEAVLARHPDADWREEIPGLVDFQLAYQPVVVGLEPDLVHAHDHQTIAAAENIVTVLRSRGRDVKMVYDSHEYVRGLPEPYERSLAAVVKLEADHIAAADAVVTVSPAIADHLHADHRLAERPSLVLNAPAAERFNPASPLSVRDAAGVGADTPLLVYSGGVKPARGLATLVAALPLLEGFHAAVVAKSDTHPYVTALLDQASELGCRDRVHVVPYVSHEQVINYLRTADLGVHPILPSGNASVALPNKLFEYLHALLPPVVSDLPAMGSFVRRTGIGDAFEPGNPYALAQACLRALSNRRAHRLAMSDPELRAEYSWERQAEVLTGVYSDLVGPPPAERPRPASGDLSNLRLAIASLNRRDPAVRLAERLRAQGGMTADGFTVSGDDDVADVARAVAGYTHVLLEYGPWVRRAATAPDDPIRDAAVGVVVRPDQARDPLRHRHRDPRSPYRRRGTAVTQKQRRRFEAVRAALERIPGAVFVSSAECVADLEGARWLPFAVSREPGIEGRPVGERDVLAVVHPVRPPSADEEAVTAACEQLAAEGTIDYRRVRPKDVLRRHEIVAGADVVLGEFDTGGYDDASVVAFLYGRIVLGHVRDGLRSSLGVPVAETEPERVVEVLPAITRDPLPWRVKAAAGPAFAERFHDGRRTLEELAPFLSAAATALPEAADGDGGRPAAGARQRVAPSAGD